MEPEMTLTNKDLLKLEHERSTSSLESTLLVCKKEPLTEIPRPQSTDGKLVTASVPTSKVLGKVKDFLGVMEESNKRMQHNAMKSDEYDIEALTGNETEYIEMDLLLGVADLHTPEAVAAAESAISSSNPVVNLAAASSDSDTEDSDDDDTDNSSSDEDEDEDDNDDNINNCSDKTYPSLKTWKSNSSSKDQPKKQAKIQEL